MPPILASVLTLCLIAYLFFRDYKTGYLPSRALWIPCLWMLVLGSRSVGEWLYLGSPIQGGEVEEGSPIDRAFFFVLMGIGFMVLANRGVPFIQIVRSNIPLALFILYCGMSILWSDFSFVAFKRWVKGLGEPIMVLIILTEPNPLRAAEIVLRVCMNLLIPTSVLFIKYYPHLGRAFSDWGAMVNTGVTTNKNVLGFTLLVYGLFLLWRLYLRWRQRSVNWQDNAVIPLILLGMVGWLFSVTDSKTPLLSLGLAAAVFVSARYATIRNHLTAFLIAGIMLFATLQWFVDVKALIATSAGRDATFTGRTEIWEAVLQMQDRPLLGFGYDSFWLGDRLRALQERWYFRPTQAHSGYIEMYLNLGMAGLALFASVVASYYRKSLKAALSAKDKEWSAFGRLGIAFLFAYLVYNYTEAAFKTPHFLYFTFLLFTIGLSRPWGQMQSNSQSRLSRKVSEGLPGGGGMRSPIINQQRRGI